MVGSGFVCLVGGVAFYLLGGAIGDRAAEQRRMGIGRPEGGRVLRAIALLDRWALRGMDGMVPLCRWSGLVLGLCGVALIVAGLV